MKFKRSLPKKIRIPRLKKKVRIALLIVALVILVIAGMYVHVIPGPGSLLHLFEPRAELSSPQSVAGTGAALATPLASPLFADFLTSPENQSDPLSIRFFDMSRGSPGTWRWDFGDNSSSSLQDPVHIYDTPGLYNASLTVTRQDGARDTVTANDVLGIRNAAGSQVLLDAIRSGAIRKGSYLSFVSADSNSSVTVNGARLPLSAGSLVKIRADSDSTTGTISLRNSNILGCSFADGTVFVNGTQAAKGNVGGCSIPSVRQYHANLTFSVEPAIGDVRQLVINGSKILAGQSNNIIVISEDTSSPENDLTVFAGSAYYEGTASGYTISPALIAGFSAISPTEGPSPLNVSFMDRSAGAPVSWSWDFGDGASSHDKNPTHSYISPGTYDVTLTVKSVDNTDTYAKQHEVIVTPPRVVADFIAKPVSGPAPLTVRFTDQSTGSPTSWNWKFQKSWDISFLGGSTTPYAVSSDPNPQITFTDPGTYNVWLAVNNVYGSSDLVKNGYIIVTAPYNLTNSDIKIQTAKPGYLEADSSAQFVISDTPAAITINGTYHDLPKGAIVRVIANSSQPGDITIDHNRILKFTFPDMMVYVNGDLLDRGPITSIYIPSMTQFQTALTYYFAPASAQTSETINGVPYLSSLDNAWIRIDNLGINSQGMLSLISATNATSIEGGMNQTEQDWILG